MRIRYFRHIFMSTSNKLQLNYLQLHVKNDLIMAKIIYDIITSWVGKKQRKIKGWTLYEVDLSKVSNRQDFVHFSMYFPYHCNSMIVTNSHFLFFLFGVTISQQTTTYKSLLLKRKKIFLTIQIHDTYSTFWP